MKKRSDREREKESSTDVYHMPLNRRLNFLFPHHLILIHWFVSLISLARLAHSSLNTAAVVYQACFFSFSLPYNINISFDSSPSLSVEALFMPFGRVALYRHQTTSVHLLSLSLYLPYTLNDLTRATRTRTTFAQYFN